MKSQKNIDHYRSHVYGLYYETDCPKLKLVLEPVLKILDELAEPKGSES